MPLNVGPQIVSRLGSPDSRIPLAVKDIVNCAGYTYFSYDAGGKIEGKDRLVEEVGTGALWIYGIPTFKKIIDKTLYKAAKISPEVDIRLLQNPEYIKQAIDNAPNKNIAEEITKAVQNTNKTKILSISKFLLSIGLTIVSYSALTKFKQNMTKKNIEKEFIQKQEKEKQNKKYEYPYYQELNKENTVYKNIYKQTTKSQTFGSGTMLKYAEDFMLNPVKNMTVLDLCISGGRLKKSRTPGELGENAIKEGSFLFFVYAADKLIKKGIDAASQKLFNAPIKLDANFLSSDLSTQILKNPDMQNEIKEFCNKFKDKTTDTSKLYEYIFKNQNSPIVKAAKLSGIIETFDANNIDTRKYIDPEKFKEMAKNLKQFIESGKEAKDIQSYLKKVRGLKVGSTILNISICCLFLGYIVPKMMYSYRKKQQNGNNEFHVKAQYEKELATKQLQKTLKES